MEQIMMLVNLSDLTNHRFRTAGTEVFADVRAVWNARGSLWSRRREASTTSRFIDREFNRPQVPWSFAARIQRSKKRERETEEKKEHFLTFNFLKSSRATRRYKTDGRTDGCPVFVLNRGRKSDETPRVARVKCAYARIGALFLSFFFLSSFPTFASLWFGLYLVANRTGILWPYAFITRRKCLFFFFFNNNDTRSCLRAR